jgi:release factor glutamine methyltransferase
VKRLIEKLNKTLAPMSDEGERNAIVRAICCDMLGIAASTYYLKEEVTLSPDREALLERIMARLKKGEPLQYIEGRASFCGMDFIVDANVLIPRPETAELVGWVAGDFRLRQPKILDLGTGSGCIAISLSKMLPHATVEACDISDGALAIARENSRRNKADVRFFPFDMLQKEPALLGSYDVLVSNPPYIKQSEAADMELHVTGWEPHLALFVPDDDALRFYRAIAEIGQTDALSLGGSVYVEINQALGKETIALFQNYGYEDVSLRKDIFGNDRMVKGVKSSEL